MTASSTTATTMATTTEALERRADKDAISLSLVGPLAFDKWTLVLLCCDDLVIGSTGVGYIYWRSRHLHCIGSTDGGQGMQLQAMAISVCDPSPTHGSVWRFWWCMRAAPCFTIALGPFAPFSSFRLRFAAARSADWLTTLGGRINVGRIACWACCCLLLINRRERASWSISDASTL
jgi:hypothetical protein